MNVYVSGQSKCNMSADAHGGKKRESDPTEPERQVDRESLDTGGGT